MKKGLKIIGIMLATVLLAGCYKINTSMTINNDKSMNFEMIYAMDMNMMSQLEGDTDSDTTTETNDENTDEFADLKKQAKEKGYEVEEYKNKENDHNWEGVKLIKKYKNIDDVTKDTEKVVNFVEDSDEDSMFDDSQFFSKKGDIYKANFLFDFGEDSSSYESYASSFDLKFTITLPNASVSNNATKTENDGRTLIWDLDISKKNEINFEFKLDPSNAGDKETAKDVESFFDEYKTYIFIGAGALVLIIIIIIIINSNKKNKPETVNNEPVSNIPNNIPNEPIVTNPLPSENTVTEQPVPQNNVDINNSNN